MPVIALPAAKHKDGRFVVFHRTRSKHIIIGLSRGTVAMYPSIAFGSYIILKTKFICFSATAERVDTDE